MPALRDAGYVQLTSLSSAVSLGNIPDGAVSCLIKPQTQAIRIRADGTDPTATVGYPLAVGAEMILTFAQLARVKIIEQAASAAVNIWWFTGGSD